MKGKMTHTCSQNDHLSSQSNVEGGTTLVKPWPTFTLAGMSVNLKEIPGKRSLVQSIDKKKLKSIFNYVPIH